MDGSFCDDVSEEYESVPGAVSYFTDLYFLSGRSQSKKHGMVLKNGFDSQHRLGSDSIETCYVVWNTVARRVEVETCLGCSLAMEVTTLINYDETTCPRNLDMQNIYLGKPIMSLLLAIFRCSITILQYLEWEVQITLPLIFLQIEVLGFRDNLCKNADFDLGTTKYTCIKVKTVYMIGYMKNTHTYRVFSFLFQ